MANVHQHIKQWMHNRQFLTTIDPDYPDWIVTVAFYVSLHAVDALLAYDKVPHIDCHRARNEVLIRTKRYEFIHRRYHPLYDLSRTIRYLASPAQWVRASDIDQQVLRRYLYPIEQSVQKLIGQALDCPPVALRMVANNAPIPAPTPSASGAAEPSKGSAASGGPLP